ncbi:NAD(P)H-binding protein [Alteriqipengyuania sp. NZ-12B]|uniref:NAD(P)H-binding protein n=1 Tax=Alteriqipengyuania abyssalis TaxID=2860200 RepID=A0ABS7PE69_9SPHN|nr:NAD-dependent epimerase/dehydratase family protein [Alteriqipengyuania abyssalis]MBY8337383.1 NAD(P)H-binding protein [Alteriqipengyuania abyssalis]
MTLALTGGTGFVGQALLDLLEDSGERVRVLARKVPENRRGFRWVDGSLNEPFKLAHLVADAECVIHIAGLTRATNPDHFEIVNVTGTLNVVEAAVRAGAKRLVFVSSLAAREPELSAYGASKRRAETIVAASGLDWTIVRPPGVYGPRDTDYLEMFRAATKGVLPVPAGGRSSMIHVQDLARLLLALREGGEGITHEIFEPDDGRDGGWTHADMARAIGDAVGKTVFPIPLPAFALHAAAMVDERVRGRNARLTRDRAGYLAHKDWTVRRDRAVPPAVWRPEILTQNGLRDTAQWYREAGML